MMTHEDRNSHEERLAGFLLRRYGGDRPAETGRPDANDLAACAHGRLLPEQRLRVEIALGQHPDLQEALAFERREAQSPAGAPRWRRRLATAAAAVLILALGIWWGITRNPASTPPVLHIAELHLGALAPAGLADCAVLAEEELRALEIRNTLAFRAETGRAAASVLSPSGLVLARRPTLAIRPAAEPARLVVFRSLDQETVFEMRVDGSPKGAVWRIPFPDAARALEPLVRYGVELRRPDGGLLASSDFMVAGDALGEHCRQRRATLEGAAIDPGLASAGMANLFLRHELFADALEALRAVPEPLRDAHWSRLLALTQSELAR